MSKATVSAYMAASDLVYFRPTQAFFDFFLQSEWKWRKYHDCGAGMGLLTQEMRKRNLECEAYDLHPREQGLVKVNQFDTARIADEMDLSEVALLARPCHHEGLIDATIHSALEMGEAFYIGKPEKIGPDLVQFWYDVLVRDVGEDGECLVRVRCDIDKHYIYRKIKSPSIQDREEWWWYSPGRRRYTSEPTGLAGFDDNPSKPVTVLEEKFLSSDLQLLTSKAEACDDSSQLGWVAPNGEWFGVRNGHHDFVARAVLGCSVGRLEKLGFCRCTDDGCYAYESRLTAKQKKTLVAKGYDPKRHG